MDKAYVRGSLLKVFAAVLLLAVLAVPLRSCGTAGIPAPAGEVPGGTPGEAEEAEMPAAAPGSGSLPPQDDASHAAAAPEPENTAVPEEAPEGESLPEEAGAAVRQGIRGMAEGAPCGAPVSAAEDTGEDPEEEPVSPSSGSTDRARQTGGGSSGGETDQPGGIPSGKTDPSGTVPDAAEVHRHVRAVRRVLVREAYEEEVIDVPARDESALVREAYDEPVFGQVSFVVCNTCGRSFPTADELFAHQAATMQGTEGEDGMHGGYHVEWEETIISYIHHEAVWETVHHDAETHTEHHPAEYRDETYCSVCGMILKEGG